MANIAVILSGCGYLDGAEIRESVIALLALDRHGANVNIFAPNIDQADVVNHLSGEATSEIRNVLVESARIARGDITPLDQLDSNQFDALVLPGGWGVAKNLSTLAKDGPNATILPDYKKAIHGFIEQQKPIGAICISPAALVAAVKDTISPTVTIGDDNDDFIASLGGVHTKSPTNKAVTDNTHRIVSCPAYMNDASISDVASGIEDLINTVINMVK